MSGATESWSIDANGIRLAVYDWGGAGAPVLLAHPTGFHGRIWAPVAARLVDTGRHVYSFDFRGHGDSDAPDVDSESYSWHNFGADVLAVTRALDIAGDRDLLACGHSKGGASLLLAEQSAPGTYARIWAYEPILVLTESALPTHDEGVLAVSARRRRNRWPTPQAAYDAYASKPPLDVMTPESLRAYVDGGLRRRADGEYELKCRPEVEARIYTMGARHDAFDRLSEVALPVRVVCGETTGAITPQFGALIADALPHGSLEVWDGRGHFGPQEDPDRAVASMLAFDRETRD